jgi:hypothetical protein
MSTHPIRGKTLHLSFKDGPMAGKTVAHTFHVDGSLDFAMVEDGKAGKPNRIDAYEVAKLGEQTYVASYLGTGGYTLTMALDLASGAMVAVSSNEKEVQLQHGSFEVPG